MRKTAGLAFLSLEFVDELFKLADHFVVIARIIASDAQDLILRELEWTSYTDETNLMCDAKVFKDLSKYRCKSDACVRLGNLN